MQSSCLFTEDLTRQLLLSKLCFQHVHVKVYCFIFLKNCSYPGLLEMLVGKVLVIFIVIFQELIVHVVSCIFVKLLLINDHKSWIINPRFKHIWGSRCLHSAPVWKPQQEKRHKRDLHPLHMCHRHKQHPVCVWCRHRCHYQEQPKGLWTVLNFTILCKQ